MRSLRSPWKAAARTLAGAKELGLAKKACHAIREDGVFVEAGENDNLIVQKLEANPAAFGIFGFSFLDQNSDKVKGRNRSTAPAPEFEAIAAGDYPVSRSLFFYVKQQHVGVIPGIKEFVTAFTSDSAWGPDGYLVDKGLIPLPDADRAAMASRRRASSPCPCSVARAGPMHLPRNDRRAPFPFLASFPRNSTA